MLNVIVFFIFLMIWVLPPFRKQGRQRMPAKKWYLLSVLTMAIPGFIVIIALQIGLGWLLKLWAPSYVVQCVVDAFICAALVEETCKFLAGRAYLRASKADRKVDYIFLFGAAGMGYEIIESLAGMSGGGIIGGIVRGVFAIHVFWQMYMGAHYYEYTKAKEAGDERAARRELRKSFLVPILLHGLNDVGLFFIDPAVSGEAQGLSRTEEYLLAAGMVIFILSFILNIILVVVTLKTAYRSANESREEEQAPAAAQEESGI